MLVLGKTVIRLPLKFSSVLKNRKERKEEKGKKDAAWHIFSCGLSVSKCCGAEIDPILVRMNVCLAWHSVCLVCGSV